MPEALFGGSALLNVKTINIIGVIGVDMFLAKRMLELRGSFAASHCMQTVEEFDIQRKRNRASTPDLFQSSSTTPHFNIFHHPTWCVIHHHLPALIFVLHFVAEVEDL